MDLSLIGPDRREQSQLGDHHRARFLLTLADLIGLAAGATIAALLILTLIV